MGALHAYGLVAHDNKLSVRRLRGQLTLRFGSTAKVLLKCKLKYYRISECSCLQHVRARCPQPKRYDSP